MIRACVHFALQRIAGIRISVRLWVVLIFFVAERTLSISLIATLTGRIFNPDFKAIHLTTQEEVLGVNRRRTSVPFTQPVPGVLQFMASE